MLPKPTKEPVKEAIQRIINLSRQARQSIHSMWLEELKLVRKDKELLLLEERVLKELEDAEHKLQSIETEQKVFEAAYEEKGIETAELAKKIFTDIKQRIAGLNAEIEHLGRQLRSIEENKLSEAKRLGIEEKRITTIHELVQKMRLIESSIAELAKSFLPGL